MCGWKDGQSTRKGNCSLYSIVQPDLQAKKGYIDSHERKRNNESERNRLRQTGKEAGQTDWPKVWKLRAEFSKLRRKIQNFILLDTIFRHKETNNRGSAIKERVGPTHEKEGNGEHSFEGNQLQCFYKFQPCFLPPRRDFSFRQYLDEESTQSIKRRSKDRIWSALNLKTKRVESRKTRTSTCCAIRETSRRRVKTKRYLRIGYLS